MAKTFFVTLRKFKKSNVTNQQIQKHQIIV